MPTCGCKGIKNHNSRFVNASKNTGNDNAYLSFAFLQGTLPFNTCVSLFAKLKKNVSILDIQAQTNIGFSDIELHWRHLLVHKPYNADLPSLHDQRQIDIINKSNNRFFLLKNVQITRWSIYHLTTINPYTQLLIFLTNYT